MWYAKLQISITGKAVILRENVIIFKIKTLNLHNEKTNCNSGIVIMPSKQFCPAVALYFTIPATQLNV
jgi:hypothetical protein